MYYYQTNSLILFNREAFMKKKLFLLTIFSFITISNVLSAAIDYEIHDIGTLQTQSSRAIAINGKGQILGWYNIDGSNTGKHYFIREKDGSFFELPTRENGVGWEINWRYLTDNGVAYGTFDGNAGFAVLYTWDQNKSVIKLGNLPGKEISAINNAGQVLIKSISDNINGKPVVRPVIWQNGQVIKLSGLCGDTGLESDESYGFDLNNNGVVVGQSVVYLSYKNKLYKQYHATKWVKGQAIDLHNTIPKTDKSSATSINDLGDVIINGVVNRADGKKIDVYGSSKATDTSYFYNTYTFSDPKGNEINVIGMINDNLRNDYNSIWMNCDQIVDMNNKGEIIAQGKTNYGEDHAMLLCPVTTTD